MGSDGLTYHQVIFPLIVAPIEGILLLPAFTAGGGGEELYNLVRLSKLLLPPFGQLPWFHWVWGLWGQIGHSCRAGCRSMALLATLEA